MKMSRYRFLAVVALFNLVLASPVVAEEADGPSEAFIEKYREATRLFQSEQLDEALRVLDEADAIESGVTDSINLRGAVFVKQQRYDEARQMFLKALEIDETLFPPKFNIGEIYFVQQQFPQAKAEFERIREEAPNPDMKQFVDYKIFLCKLLDGDRAEAVAFRDERFTFMDNTPAYHFSQAATEFHEGNEDKAVEWLGSAYGIFPPQVNAIFLDSIIELGWINREEAISEVVEEN